MTRFVRSEITERLAAYLRTFDKGASVSYRELSEQVASRIDASSHQLRSARTILQAQHNQVWDAVAPGVGVYRLNDREIAERLGTWWLPGARRKLSRGRAQVAVVDLQQLSLDEQARLGVRSIQSELATQALSRAAANRLGKVARGSSNDLPAFNVIEWAITLMGPPSAPKRKE